MHNEKCWSSHVEMVYYRKVETVFSGDTFILPSSGSVNAGFRVLLVIELQTCQQSMKWHLPDYSTKTMDCPHTLRKIYDEDQLGEQ